jgi:octaheme c-type cytochrome (tetrathionate reductase family)
MKRIFIENRVLYLVLVSLTTVAAIAIFQSLYVPKEPNLNLEALRVKYSKERQMVLSHKEFPILQQPFGSPQEVTKACLSCHTETHNEVMTSSHWNWDRISYIDGRGITSLGKKNVLNNYCIGVGGNEQMCASCHVGFGLDDVANFDFEVAENVDCLACHAQTDDYFKGTALAGLPDASVDLNKAAQSVRIPQIENCGTCHFYSGGGNNVKHGDLEEALYSADRDLDVHMAKNGIDMTCVDCHTAEDHQIKGKLYSVSSANVNRLLCEDCHSPTPHLSDMLNTHTASIACQTCHIPEYAKANPTKLSWKWSEAGHLKDGKPYTMDDESGSHTYMSKKGSFEWGTNLKPDYVWFNGKADHYLFGDKIDTSAGPVQINRLLGGKNDPGSKIIPVKIHRGDQIYDTYHNHLIQPKLYGNEQDSAFWSAFDWDKAAAAGMKDIGLPYSGNYDFVETEMYWPINHMVAPAAQSLQCADCHTNETDGRLAKLTGFYLPGRDRSDFLDWLGVALIWASVFGVVVHSSIRVWSHLKNQENLEMENYEDFQDEAN